MQCNFNSSNCSGPNLFTSLKFQSKLFQVLPIYCLLFQFQDELTENVQISRHRLEVSKYLTWDSFFGLFDGNFDWILLCSPFSKAFSKGMVYVSLMSGKNRCPKFFPKIEMQWSNFWKKNDVVVHFVFFFNFYLYKRLVWGHQEKILDRSSIIYSQFLGLVVDLLSWLRIFLLVLLCYLAGFFGTFYSHWDVSSQAVKFWLKEESSNTVW